ncbi:NAD(P)H-binding protein [Streptomyces sp. NPDC047046]|uniref:NAD(P)-dependent oxidoreductase n=1 Tax=Streptomyces sp. NPDC047046 TaxID=3155378 RepID=UPI00340D943F
MRITVFGASGRAGRAFLHAAARAGHECTAVVRDPERLAGAPAARVVRGGPFEEGGVSEALAGADAALVAYALRGGRRNVPLYSRGTRTIVDAMRRTRVSRLLVLSEAAYGPHTAGPLNRTVSALYRATARPVIRQREEQDAIIAASGLDWTIVRPVILVEGPAHGHRRAPFTPHHSRAPRTTYADLAHVLLDALDDPATYRRDLYP